MTRLTRLIDRVACGEEAIDPSSVGGLQGEKRRIGERLRQPAELRRVPVDEDLGRTLFVPDNSTQL